MCILPLVESAVTFMLFVSLYVHSVVYVLFIIFVYETVCNNNYHSAINFISEVNIGLINTANSN